MKKIFLLLVLIVTLSLTGCAKESELICDIGITTVTITLKDGKIINYIDKLDGELESEAVNQLNNAYLQDTTTNDDAMAKLRDVIASMGGICRQDNE